ncbi:MAG: ABC transporter ATP-binding protein [Erysipelotrichaceae bacterium]|nr:ABC transporter ATP-binding protein [Erysipelotrichaceae bacterium]
MFRKFLSYYKPHRLMFALDMLASFIISVIGIIYPIITRKMLNDFIPNRQLRMVVIFGLLLLMMYVVKLLLRFFVQYYGHLIGVSMQAAMRKDLFQKLQEMPFSFFDEHETGKIMSRLVHDLADVSELAHHGPENFFICGITIVVSFFYLSSINLKLARIIFSCIPFLVCISYYLSSRLREAEKQSRAAVASINASVQSSVTGIRITKAFVNQQKEIEKFDKSNEEFVSAKARAYKRMGQFFSTTTFITDIFNVITLISGGIFLYNGEITFGDYSAFIVSISIFVQPVNQLVNFVEQFQAGSTGFARFYEIMMMESEKDKPNAKDFENLNGDIVFDHVSFSYDDEKKVLKDVSFKVNSGETLALVGPSGGGKTTICHLLPRFYDANAGSIRIGNHDITDITLQSLRKSIGIVQQDVFLFSGSFYENIIYGRPDASREEVIEAAKKANIYDYIMSLPHGFDSEIGERGVRLSGGQKQRLSIARVFLKNPPILILDEATSALDNITEILIQNALDSLREGRTTIVVAHRLSTIRNANEILVVDGGKIIEQGNHQSLMDKNGIYANLYNSQFKALED